MRAPESLSSFINKIENISRDITDATAALARNIEQASLAYPACAPEMFLQNAVKATLQLHIKDTLARTPWCSGAGFASHIESTAYWLLEWWYKRGAGDEQASLELDQATQQRLDFRAFEWFSYAPAGGQPRIHGPYVDYICNTAYTLTSTLAVYGRGVFLGVAAVDVLVSRLETALLPHAGDRRVVLTNREQRIIFSTCPRRRIGDLMEAEAPEPVYQNDSFLIYQL